MFEMICQNTFQEKRWRQAAWNKWRISCILIIGRSTGRWRRMCDLVNERENFEWAVHCMGGWIFQMNGEKREIFINKLWNFNKFSEWGRRLEKRSLRDVWRKRDCGVWSWEQSYATISSTAEWLGNGVPTQAAGGRNSSLHGGVRQNGGSQRVCRVCCLWAGVRAELSMERGMTVDAVVWKNDVTV